MEQRKVVERINNNNSYGQGGTYQHLESDIWG